MDDEHNGKLNFVELQNSPSMFMLFIRDIQNLSNAADVRAAKEKFPKLDINKDKMFITSNNHIAVLITQCSY